MTDRSRRLACSDDLEAVFALYMDPTVVPFLGFDPMSIDEFGPVFSELVESGGFFVYEVSGEVAGFYKASRYRGRVRHVGCLATLAVAAKYQGHGVAETMVAEAVEELRSAGVERVELFVESDNPRGISFYERLGFRIEARLEKFYKRAGESAYVDEFIMARLFDRRTR